MPLTRRRRWLRRGLLTFSILVGLYAGLVVGAAYLFLHTPRTPVTRTPKSLQLRFEEVRFASATDQLPLRGWFLPADGKARGVIVFCHGRQGNRASVLAHARYLHRAGFALFSFDFRASGDSGGDMTTIGWREVGDALGAIRYVRTRPDTQRLPVGLFGMSMGAAVVTQAAAVSPDVACVVADSAYASLDRAVDQRFRGVFGPGSEVLSVPVQWVGEQMMGVRAVSVSPLAAIPKIAPRPVFLIHGTADTLIRPNDSRELYAAAGNPKQLWLVPGAAHVQSYHIARDEYQRRVTSFFRQSLSVRQIGPRK